MSVVRRIVCHEPRLCKCCDKVIGEGQVAVKVRVGTTGRAERRRRRKGKLPLGTTTRRKMGLTEH